MLTTAIETLFIFSVFLTLFSSLALIATILYMKKRHHLLIVFSILFIIVSYLLIRYHSTPFNNGYLLLDSLQKSIVRGINLTFAIIIKMCTIGIIASFIVFMSGVFVKKVLQIPFLILIILLFYYFQYQFPFKVPSYITLLIPLSCMFLLYLINSNKYLQSISD